MMNIFYFSKLLPELADKSAQAVIRRLNIRNKPFCDYVQQSVSTQLDLQNTLIGDPVFEATFGWQSSATTMEDLSGNLLNMQLVEAMNAPYGDSNNEYRFGKSYQPYQHQLEAWSLLSQAQAQSVVVTSGTGSGKTECFFVPILDDLVRQFSEEEKPLIGVQALLIYPLNALIASQRERLSAWTSNFGRNIRFCLYNGTTPVEEPNYRNNEVPNQVLDRKSLWASPPPILVTNPTMLEYMLVRTNDIPIIQKSQGKLKWIILDEAHTYIGSKAAELTLLLRRVMLAFGVSAEQVHFIATSATLGGQNAKKQLQQFLASVSGLPLSRIHVVQGQRHIPALSRGNSRYKSASYDELFNAKHHNTYKLYQALLANQTALGIRHQFTSSTGPSFQKLSALTDFLNSSLSRKHTALETLQWLDLLTYAKSKEGIPFLSLRLHAFHTVLNGFWACSNPTCRYIKGTSLDSQDWPFGKVYFRQRVLCDCSHPIYEIRPCSNCDEIYLWANQSVIYGYNVVSQESTEIDEFSIDAEVYEVEENTSLTNRHQKSSPLLIFGKKLGGIQKDFLEAESFKRDGKNGATIVSLNVNDPISTSRHDIFCYQCGTSHSLDQPLFHSLRLGAPFFQQVILPILLKYAPAYAMGGSSDALRPNQGKRLITFTDSRQATARIALKCQQDAERYWLESQVYRTLVMQDKEVSVDSKQKILYELEDLKNRYQTAQTAFKPMIEELIRIQQKTLAQLEQPQVMTFKQMLNTIKLNNLFLSAILPVYKEKNPEDFGDEHGAERLAQIFLLREFARRPSVQDNLETLGLVCVTYPKLTQIKQVPDFKINRWQMTLVEWKALLKLLLDLFVRHCLVLKMPEAWATWSGHRIPTKFLLTPHNIMPSKQYVAWPHIQPTRFQSKIVRLLAISLDANLYIKSDCQAIDEILMTAFEVLTQVKLLQPYGDRWLLHPEDMGLSLVKEFYVCPITGNKLDTVFRGVTPFTPKSQRSHQKKPVVGPSFKVPFISNQHLSLDEPQLQLSIEHYLQEHSQVMQLRRLGYWHDLHDKIIRGSPYYRVVEHSAQQSSKQLKQYEQDFRNGFINIMSCSTTMEMGVDIGGISVVAMNNVPPHPANYLQRAGRAGRRHETRSVVLTICKNTPHDQYVFKNTLWPFLTPMPAPRVSLNSDILVQRHIHSYLLALFLKQYHAVNQDIPSLDMAWWMLPIGNSPSNDFINWLNTLGDNLAVINGLVFLLKKTRLESESLENHVSKIVNLYQAFSTDWLSGYVAIQKQLHLDQKTEEGSESILITGLKDQEQRLLAEYLLAALIKAGLLPAYGFPTRVASFDTLNMSSRSKYNKARFDLKRELPSRETNIALM